MILIMIRHFAIALLMIGAISGQATKVPKIRIVFPQSYAEKAASIAYGFHDPANDDWELFNRVSPQSDYSFPEIPARADRLKALVWASGCQMKHFDVPVDKPDLELQFTCDPLKTVPFQGRVLGVKVGEGERISVAYVSLETLFWFYDWKQSFGSSDAPEMPEIATAPVSPDGTFKMQLPDLSVDPIASRESWAWLEFRITGAKHHQTLRPQVAKGIGTRGGEIKVAPSYPVEVTFLTASHRD
jgi:hypothetical protein